MTPPLSQPSSFAKGYGGQEGKAMKLKIDWKELGRRLWEAVKECLGGSLLTAVVASGETRARLGRDTVTPRPRDAALLRRFRRGESGARPRLGWWFLLEDGCFLRLRGCDVRE